MSPSPNPTTRRPFPTHFAGAGPGTTLLLGVLWERMPEAGLEPSQEDRDAMLQGVNPDLDRCDPLREVHIPDDVSPPMLLSPLVPGMGMPASALARVARRAEAEPPAGRRYRGSLHGSPWGSKDIITVRDHPATWGADAYPGQAIDQDSAVVDPRIQAQDLAALDAMRGLGVELVEVAVPESTTDLSPIGLESSVFFDKLVRSGRDQEMTNPGQAGPTALQRHSSLADLATHPFRSLPEGFAETGTPNALFVFGQPFGESEVPAVAKAYQDVTGFHRERPALWAA